MDINKQITSLANELGKLLLEKTYKISTAESCTGGGIAEAITRISGSSQWFEIGFVTYSNRAKVEQLGVEENLLTKVGAVSQEVVEAMARGALKKSKANFSVAVSGIAGPDGGTPEKPVGTVWIGWAGEGEKQFSYREVFAGDREEIRASTVVRALEGLILLTKNENPCINA